MGEQRPGAITRGPCRGVGSSGQQRARGGVEKKRAGGTWVRRATEGQRSVAQGGGERRRDSLDGAAMNKARSDVCTRWFGGVFSASQEAAAEGDMAGAGLAALERDGKQPWRRPNPVWPALPP